MQMKPFDVQAVFSPHVAAQKSGDESSKSTKQSLNLVPSFGQHFSFSPWPLPVLMPHAFAMSEQ
jgi:hypothetical protein